MAGELRDAPATRAALAELGKLCAELSPWAVVFHSPPLFSPSTGNRERLRQFFAEVAPAELFGGAQRVWVPDGLWESLAAVRFATELGITCAIDPLVQIPGAPLDLHLHYEVEQIYFRINAIGRTRGLREDDLISVEELSMVYPEAAFILATMERWKDAKNVLQRLREEATELDPIARMSRRTGGEALAFQRPAGASAAAAGAAMAAGGAMGGGQGEGDDEDFDDEDFDDEDFDDEDEGEDEDEGADEVGDAYDDDDDDDDSDDDDDE
jgi:hypothetical protein